MTGAKSGWQWPAARQRAARHISAPSLLLSLLPQIQFVLGLLEQHPTLELVVVSDSDCVWLRPPWQYLEQRQGVDFFVSTDCLSAKVRGLSHRQPTHRECVCVCVCGCCVLVCASRNAARLGCWQPGLGLPLVTGLRLPLLLPPPGPACLAALFRRPTPGPAQPAFRGCVVQAEDAWQPTDRSYPLCGHVPGNSQ